MAVKRFDRTACVWNAEDGARIFEKKKRAIAKDAEARRERLPRPEAHKESPDEIVFALQNIFCRGRYRSWRPSLEARSKKRRV